MPATAMPTISHKLDEPPDLDRAGATPPVPLACRRRAGWSGTSCHWARIAVAVGTTGTGATAGLGTVSTTLQLWHRTCVPDELSGDCNVVPQAQRKKMGMSTPKQEGHACG